MANYLIDPLAQSFFIERPTTITKVDLFFSAKDNVLPFIMHIRKNVNGSPGDFIIPFSEKAVYGADVNVSANANVATTVTFDSPIYLDTGEYSITLGSSSKNYRVWVSELDKTDIVTSTRITEQPYIGTLYKSQNASTWSPEQLQDLKFRIYRGVFNTNVTSTIELVPENIYTRASLGIDPLELFPSSSTMRVYHLNHGLVDSGYVKISGLANAVPLGDTTSFFGINVSSLDQVTFSVSNVTLNTYTVDIGTTPDANISVATRFGGYGVIASQDIPYETIYPAFAAVTPTGTTLRSQFLGTSTSYITDATYTELIEDEEIDLEETKILAGDITKVNNLSNQESLKVEVLLSSTDPYVSPIIDTKQLNLTLVRNLINNPSYSSENLSYDEVRISSNVRVTLSKVSNSIGQFTFDNDNDKSNALALVSGTFINLSGNNLSSGSQYRVIQVTDSGANVRVANVSGLDIVAEPVGNTFIITNGRKFIAEEAPSGGSVFSKYITRQFDFVNPNTSFNFRLDVYKPAGADIKVYYKTKLVGEVDILTNKEYEELTDITCPISLSDEFYEVEKQVDNLPEFNSIILKINFTSTNAAKVPKISNLRLIALA